MLQTPKSTRWHTSTFACTNVCMHLWDLFLLQQFSQFIWCNCSQQTKSNICVFIIYTHIVLVTLAVGFWLFQPHFRVCVVRYVRFVLFLICFVEFFNKRKWMKRNAERQAPNAFEYCVMCVFVFVCMLCSHFLLSICC